MRILIASFAFLLVGFVLIKNRSTALPTAEVSTPTLAIEADRSLSEVGKIEAVEIAEKPKNPNEEKMIQADQPIKTEQPTVPLASIPDDQTLEEDALLSLKENEPERAEATLRSILEENPANKVALGELLFLLESTKRTDEAKDLLESITRKCASCSDARLGLGDIYLKEKSFEQAVSYFKEAVRFSDVKDAALRKLSSAYGQSGQGSKAVATLREIIRSSNNEIHRLKRLGVETNILEQAVSSDRRELAKREQDLGKEG